MKKRCMRIFIVLFVFLETLTALSPDGFYTFEAEGAGIKLRITSRDNGNIDVEGFEMESSDGPFPCTLETPGKLLFTDMVEGQVWIDFNHETQTIRLSTTDTRIEKYSGDKNGMSGVYYYDVPGFLGECIIEGRESAWTITIKGWSAIFPLSVEKKTDTLYYLRDPESDGPSLLEISSTGCVWKISDRPEFAFLKDSGENADFFQSLHVSSKPRFDFPSAETGKLVSAGRLEEAFIDFYGAPLPPSYPFHSSELLVTEKYVTPEKREMQFLYALSPDGKYVLAQRRQSIIVTDLHTGDDIAEYLLEGEGGAPMRADPSSFRWSPDGLNVVFSEDYIISYADSDLYLFNIHEKGLKSLTADGVTRITNVDSEIKYTIDMTPLWLSNSQILYQQISRSAAILTNLALYNLVPMETSRFPQEIALEPTVRQVRAAPGGNKIFFSFLGSGRSASMNGIWMIKGGGYQVKRIISPAASYDKNMFIADTDFSGRYLLLYMPMVLDNYGAAPGGNYQGIELYDYESGTREPVPPAGAPEILTTNAVFSPDGTKIAAVQRLQGKTRLVICDTADMNNSMVIFDSDRDLPESGVMLRGIVSGRAMDLYGLQWTLNDTIAAIDQTGARYLIFKLGAR